MSCHGRLLLVAGGLALGGCGRQLPPADPRFVAELMQNQYGWIRSERISPPVASRVTAYAALAVFEGLATQSTTLRSQSGQLAGFDPPPAPPADQPVDRVIVALAAERVVLDTLFREGLPQTQAAIATVLDSLRASRTALGIAEEVVARSEAHGTVLGAAIIAWAARDGFDTTRAKPWVPQKGRAVWVNSSGVDDYVPQNLSGARDLVSFANPSASLKPGEASERALIVNRPKSDAIATLRAINPAGATEPWWGTLRPFILRRVDECPIPAPPPYSESTGSAFHQEGRAVFEASRQLTEEKRRIVLYWADNPGQTGTPSGHWLAIGSQMVAQRRLDADAAAELFLVVSLAQADAFIAGWDVKYRTMVVRPNTYLNRVFDRRWRPEIITPAFPEYPSGHSVQSAAVATVMTRLIGDSVAFDDSTNISIGHAVRRFSSFRAAADEAGISRLYGGIHFPMAITNGASLGQCIGKLALERLGTRRR